MQKKTASKTKISSRCPVYHVYVTGERGSYVLQDLSREDFFGIPCVVGLFAKPAVDWLYGQRVRIPVDKVMLVVEYASIDAYNRKLKSHELRRSRSSSDIQ
ncbi:MAG: hypothetical protein FJ308_21010 [Planctomycetes bacterium]|nr:hypothetical protein [Planctomycetota bacterium]